MNKLNSTGFSILEVLISFAIMSIGLAAMLSLMSMQNKEIRANLEKLQALEVERVLISALNNGSTCLHLVNNPAVLTFDSTAITPLTPAVVTPTLPIYANVVGGIPGPTVAQVGQPLSSEPGSLVVGSIDLKITSGSAGNYLGYWEVGFNHTKLVRPIKPIRVNMIFGADDSTVTAAKILSCNLESAGGGGGGLTSCPAGMNMVGIPGKYTTYCIEANERTAQTYSVAVNTCYAINDATVGHAHVCNYDEWNTACTNGSASTMAGNWEWISVPYGHSSDANGYVLVVGLSNCFSSSYSFIGHAYPFRCCLR